MANKQLPNQRKVNPLQLLIDNVEYDCMLEHFKMIGVSMEEINNAKNQQELPDLLVHKFMKLDINVTNNKNNNNNNFK